MKYTITIYKFLLRLNYYLKTKTIHNQCIKSFYTDLNWYWFKFHTINILVIKWLCIINVFLKLNTVFICYVYMWLLVVCAVFDTLILKTKWKSAMLSENAKSLLIYVCITSGYRTSHSNAHFTPNTNLVDMQRCMESYNAIVLMQALPTMK